MNWQILRLVGDHTRRLFGLWLVVAMLQIMQTSALWVFDLGRMPLIGAVMCAMGVFATSKSPFAVMRTLPIRRRDLALYRWWMTIGVPAPLIYACVGIAWINNRSSPHPPSQLEGGAVLLAMFAALGVLSVLPLPTLKANLSNLPRFCAIWIVVAGAALYGFPVELVTKPVSLVLGVGGAAIAVVSFVMACKGEILAFPLKEEAAARRTRASQTSRIRLHGWRLLFAQLAKSTVVLAFTCIACATAVRNFLPGLEIALPLIFVAVAGTAGALMSRRWLHAIDALQCLPVRDRTIALVIWISLTAPGLITCLASNAVHAWAPSWGVAVPLFMFPVFVVIPLLLASWKTVESSNGVATSAQRWSPILQIGMWPLWVGSLSSLIFTKLMPVWASGVALAITTVVSLIGYYAMLAGVRGGRLPA